MIRLKVLQSSHKMNIKNIRIKNKEPYITFILCIYIDVYIGVCQ